jgi:KDO2-lipid IV(A) lauroyltransferase
LLCVPAHHGNWELCGYTASLLGYPFKSVARPLDNVPLNTLITEMRERSGNEIIQKWKVLWKLKKLLDHGGIVTMSIDQNGGVAGLFVPFFNVLASTVTSPAELHLLTGTPIIVGTLNRLPDGVRHVFRLWDIIEHKRTDDHAADVTAVVKRINGAVERSIRAYPEQWLWVHKRWKTRPPGELPGADGLPPRVDGVTMKVETLPQPSKAVAAN